MKRAKVYVDDRFAGYLVELEQGNDYEFRYLENYASAPVSLTMPTTQPVYHFDKFPTFFEGFLPEGMMLEGLLMKTKIEKDDLFEQLLFVGEELVGNVTIKRDL